MFTWAALIAWLWSHKHLAADAALVVIVVLCRLLRETFIGEWISPQRLLLGFTLPEVLLSVALVAHHRQEAVAALWVFFFPAKEGE